MPVSYHVVDGVHCVFTGAPWLANLRGGGPFEVILRGSRRPARAEIVDDEEAVARTLHRVLTEIGPRNASRFAFKITGEVPPPERVREALAGRRLLRLTVC